MNIDWLEAQACRLGEAWEPHPASQTPAGLVERTLVRLEREGLLTGRVVRVDWRRRVSSLAGVAAAAALVAVMRLTTPPAASVSWMSGLELAESFPTPMEETAVRLDRVADLLSDGEPGAVEETGGLRERLDQLADEAEAF